MIFIKFFFFFILISCATYTDQTSEVRNQLINGNPSEALAILDKSSIAAKKKDEVLFRMERGMLHYLSGHYEKANRDWERSFLRSEELYTISLSRSAASLAVSEDMTDYEGEEHERVMLPIFSSLAYFSLGDLNAALVEVRKAYNLISKLKLEVDSKSNRIDGFPFFISGILYEASGNWDAAIIEYRKALAVYKRTDWNGSAPGGMIKLTAESLWRIAEFRGRKEILSQLAESNYTKPSDSLRARAENGELIVIIESGQSPIKVARDYPVNYAEGFVNISFPAYQSITQSGSSTRILCDGVECSRTTKASDIEVLAENALEQRRVRDFAKLAARLVIKEGARRAAQKHLGELGGFAAMIANAMTERGDTRSWTLLPENIQVARIPMAAGKSTRITISNSNTLKDNSWVVSVPAGRKKLLRIRTMF
jgi:hypothetical protein